MWKPKSGSGLWGLLYRETECGNLGAVVGAVIPGN